MGCYSTATIRTDVIIKGPQTFCSKGILKTQPFFKVCRRATYGVEVTLLLLRTCSVTTNRFLFVSTSLKAMLKRVCYNEPLTYNKQLCFASFFSIYAETRYTKMKLLFPNKRQGILCIVLFSTKLCATAFKKICKKILLFFENNKYFS